MCKAKLRIFAKNDWIVELFVLLQAFKTTKNSS